MYEYWSNMFDDCAGSSAYITLPEDAAAFAALRDKIKSAAPDSLQELVALANEYSCTSTLEGFINGWSWAQATARECLELRKPPKAKGLQLDISPDLLSAAVEAMRELQERYEAEAAAFASLGDPGYELARERLESAKVAQGLFSFFADV